MVQRNSVAGDTATVGDDFATVSSFNVTIPATQSSGEAGTFSLTPVNDAIAEGDETLQVSGICHGPDGGRSRKTDPQPMMTPPPPGSS